MKILKFKKIPSPEQHKFCLKGKIIIHVCLLAGMHVCLLACMQVCLLTGMHVCLLAGMRVCLLAGMRICPANIVHTHLRLTAAKSISCSHDIHQYTVQPQGILMALIYNIV